MNERLEKPASTQTMGESHASKKEDGRVSSCGCVYLWLDYF
jgi:hypothetical protein